MTDRKTSFSSPSPPPSHVELRNAVFFDPKALGTLFFDETNKQFVSVKEKEILKIPLVSSKPPSVLKIRTKPNPIEIKFSTDQKFFGIQYLVNELDIVNFETAFGFSFRPRRGQFLLKYFWTSPELIFFITSEGIELYKHSPSKSLRFLKEIKLPLSWFSYYPDYQILLTAHGSQSNQLTIFSFIQEDVHRLPRLDIGVVENEVLQSADISLTKLYSGLYCIHSHAAKQELVVYKWKRDSFTILQKFGYPIGSIGFSFIDNLIAVHNASSKISFLYDIRDGTGYPISAPLPIAPFSCMKDDSEFRLDAQQMYDPDWRFLFPNFLVDEKRGITWELCVNLGEVIASMSEEKIFPFLMRRNHGNSKLLLLEHIRKVILRREKIDIVSTVMETIVSVLASFLKQRQNAMLMAANSTSPAPIQNSPSSISQTTNSLAIPGGQGERKTSTFFTTRFSMYPKSYGSPTNSPTMTNGTGLLAKLKSRSNPDLPAASFPLPYPLSPDSELAEEIEPKLSNPSSTPESSNSSLEVNSPTEVEGDDKISQKKPEVDSPSQPQPSPDAKTTKLTRKLSSSLSLSSLPITEQVSFQASFSASTSLDTSTDASAQPPPSSSPSSLSALLNSSPSSPAAQPTSAASVYQARKFEGGKLSSAMSADGQVVIKQSEFFSYVLLPVEEESISGKMDNRYYASVLIEYIRALNANHVPVEPYVHELLINALVRSKRFYQLHQFLQYHVISDSIDIACHLLSIEEIYPLASQLALDMFKRLSSPEQIIEALISRKMILPALRVMGLMTKVPPVVPSSSAPASTSPSPAYKFLEIASSSEDAHLFFTVFKFLQEKKLIGHDCAQFVDQFVKQFHRGP